MKKENLIVKWLDLSLNAEELEAFKKLDAAGSFLKISDTAKQFKAPNFDSESSYKNLLEKLIEVKKTTRPWKNYVASIAAIFVITIGLYFAFFNVNQITYTAANAEHIVLSLPDLSKVELNSGSELVFDERHWNDYRNLSLKGEAYFKVEKGSSFTVETAHGLVSVLGTEFNVKARNSYFEVSCYEGKVQVDFNNKIYLLNPGNSFRVINNEIKENKTTDSLPMWTKRKSVFKSVPIGDVIEELERQYNVQISAESINKSIIFTGSFTHDNLETAIKAITIPLDITYEIQKDFVTFKTD